ncbi:MAG: GGDEF domain-containing protein, partial [Kangiellaceae bacterium]|nr:GGDEF domain-containing protein [Kangiellaceae bacterium]
VVYKEVTSGLSFSVGEEQAHHCRYQLVLEGEELGEIICTRNKPFSIRETNLLERVLSLLIYPLRNALLYHAAIAQAHRDPLTQIGNRAAFDEALKKHISSFERHRTNFSLMVIDIDFFKNVNDTFGHIAGDKVLKSVAKTVQNTLRRSDEVFRYGGEEFVVILGNTQQGGAKFIAERIRKAIEDLQVELNKMISVTTSIGIAASEKVDDVRRTLELADKALYQAKENGRNQVSVC